MTERYKLKWVPKEHEPFEKRIIYDTLTKKEYNCTMKHQDDLCNLLNELHEENEQLKQRIQELEQGD